MPGGHPRTMKIPPHPPFSKGGNHLLPLAKGGITPLWQRGARPVEWGILLHRARGDFLSNMSTQL